MKRLLTLASVLFLGGVASSAFGMDATWAPTNNYNLGFYWGTLDNWLVDGVKPTIAPTNFGDTVVFPHTATKRRQSIYAGTSSTTSSMIGLAVDSVTGDTSYEIFNGGIWSSGGGNPRNPLTVVNPNGFTGFWGAPDSQQIYVFPSTASFTPQVYNLDVQGRPTVRATGNGTVAVDALYNSGALVKDGPADLSIAGSLGAANGLIVNEGNVILPANAALDTLDSVLAQAYLHLDASDETTFEYQEGSQTAVTNWLDVRKDGRSAWVPSNWSYFGADRVKVAHPPFLTAERSPTGLPLLDFGSCFNADAEPLYGPTNCCLEFAPISNGAEVFAVVRYHEKFGMNAILGDYNLAPMQPYGGAIFGGSANENLSTGHFYLDGVLGKTTDTPADGLTNGLHVLSFGPATNLTVRTIGVDQNFAARCGGMMFGEILIFTNELSRTDRLRVNNYLRRKWVLGGLDQQDVDLGSIMVRNAASQLKVESGKTAKVLDVVAENGTFIKTGDGELQIDTVHPADATVDVRGGSVSFRRQAVPQLQIAANPLVRLDAAVGVTTEYDETYATNFVTSWKDCRADVETAAVPFSVLAKPHYPTVLAAASPTGLDVLDFGSTYGTVAGMTLPWYGQAARVYSGFIVMKQSYPNQSYVPFFGCKDMSMERENSTGGGTHCRILHNFYPNPAAMSALWTINGRPVEPTVYMPEYFGANCGFIVVAFSAHRPIAVDAIALGRNQDTRVGGIQVGEYILYDRELSEAERRNTEAYLMDKWLGAAHPAAASSYNLSYAVASDQPAVLDYADDATVPSVSGGNGTVLKVGAGAVTVNTIKDSPVAPTIVVNEGNLAVRVASFEEDALMHFDTTDEDTLVYTNGVLAQWKDVRGNGLVAETDWQHASKAPTLDTVTTANSVQRKMVNFGYLASSTARMVLNQNFSNVREAHVVLKGISPHFLPLTWAHDSPYSPGTTQHIDYYRSGNGQIINSDSSSACVRNGGIWINGEARVFNDIITPTDSMLMSFAPTANTYVNSIQGDRAMNGGAYVGEQIAFSRTLTEPERDYLMKKLMYKWFEVGEEPVWTNINYAAVSVASGANLTFTHAADPFVAELGGSGTVKAKKVQGVACLSCDGDEVAAGDYLQVDGEVIFAPEVEVDVSNITTGRQFLNAGDYPILSATTLTNVDVSNWTLTGVDEATARKFALKQVGETICLSVSKPGLLLIVK